MKKSVGTKGKGQSRFINSTAQKEENNPNIETSGLKLSWVRFLNEYIKNGGNGKNAYKAVFPDVKNDNVASVQASILLKNPNVRAELNNKLEAQMVTEESVTNMALWYAKAGMIDKNYSNSGMRAVEMLGKMKGMLVDTKKIEFNGNNPAIFTPLMTKDDAEKIDEATKTSRIIE